MIRDITIKLLSESGEKIEDRSFQAIEPLAVSQRFHEGMGYIEGLTERSDLRTVNYQILIEVKNN